ncbi:hypothetical protein K435DRAFT_866505 [Dendrothele bispora CBS 962.96]|uniref:DUF1793-domain-containing protein n=1 Tax=Dendrothele bispora (strain CBS 962.96) TaxID=1314807 RepID=A0A4S8LGK6_DENBC|nr:hypothetical protein K435DRAFT_866505 [Dendrothele bispora CBS 962.96]
MSFCAHASPSNLRPPGIPLVVRSPWLNTWNIPEDTSSNYYSYLPEPVPLFWPNYWNLQVDRVTGLTVLVRLDNTTYLCLGNPDVVTDGSISQPNIIGLELTPTSSKFILNAENLMAINLTFLNPVEPEDLVKQSFPFTYIYIDAQTMDGNPHATQFYIELSGQWVSGSTPPVEWHLIQEDSNLILNMHRQEILPMVSDGNGMMEDGTRNGLTYQTGDFQILRQQFNHQGTLTNVSDPNFRSVSDNWPEIALSVDQGKIQATDQSFMAGIGFTRNISVSYTSSSMRNQNRKAFFSTRYSQVEDAIDEFLGDFDAARQRAEKFDQMLLKKSESISDDYADLVTLAIPQTMASVEWTVDEGGEDTLAFFMDAGDYSRGSPVEGLYFSFPAFMFINTTWGQYLLEPLLRDAPQDFASADLGGLFPNVSVYTSPNYPRALEDSSSMLIMVAAQFKYSADRNWLKKEYYSTLTKWADFLIENNCIFPDDTFITLEGQSGGNSTNLALKSILALGAMAQISAALGHSNDSLWYGSKAREYSTQWGTLVVEQTGAIPLSYNSQSSSAMTYNLFADRWLQTNLVDQSIYDGQAKFYTQTQPERFGFNYQDQTENTAFSPITIFLSAALEGSARNHLISGIHEKANDTSSRGIFPTHYDSVNASTLGGSGSIQQGSMLAILALNLESQFSYPIPASLNSQQKTIPTVKSRIAKIIGGIIGSMTLFCITALSFWYWRKQKRLRSQCRAAVDPFYLDEHPHRISHIPAKPTLGRSVAEGQQASFSLQNQVQDLQRDMNEMRNQIEYPPSYHTTYYHRN